MLTPKSLQSGFFKDKQWYCHFAWLITWSLMTCWIVLSRIFLFSADSDIWTFSEDIFDIQSAIANTNVSYFYPVRYNLLHIAEIDRISWQLKPKYIPENYVLCKLDETERPTACNAGYSADPFHIIIRVNTLESDDHLSNEHVIWLICDAGSYWYTLYYISAFYTKGHHSHGFTLSPMQHRELF